MMQHHLLQIQLQLRLQRRIGRKPEPLLRAVREGDALLRADEELVVGDRHAGPDVLPWRGPLQAPVRRGVRRADEDVQVPDLP